MVEFALIVPIVLLLLLTLLDFGRGLFYYSEMAAGAREAARQGTLLDNQNSNTSPSAGALPSVPGVIAQVQRLAAFGYSVEAYGNCQPNSVGGPVTGPLDLKCGRYSGSRQLPADAQHAGGWAPGEITLAPLAHSNVLYVFVYELDAKDGSTSWDAGSHPVRSGGHKLVVVDLKLRWAPAALKFAGLGPLLLFDAVSAQREEW